MESAMDVVLYDDHPVPRNPISQPVLCRLPPAVRQQLSDPAALAWHPERLGSWFGAGITPPVVSVERGREVETLSSVIIATLRRLDVPIPFAFEVGWSAVTRWIGFPLDVSDEGEAPGRDEALLSTGPALRKRSAP
jgi:hypothetical protein